VEVTFGPNGHVAYLHGKQNAWSNAARTNRSLLPTDAFVIPLEWGRLVTCPNSCRITHQPVMRPQYRLPKPNSRY
jgi:hypothetical protein